MNHYDDTDTHEVIGMALQRIGEIIENDPTATVTFTENHNAKLGPHTSEIAKTTTEVTLEVSGEDK